MTNEKMSATHPNQSQPNQDTIANFYANKTIFITGGTGFMGKVLLEKLLRSCPNIKKIYLLIRKKREQSINERLQQLIKSPLFDEIRQIDLKRLNKVAAIEGDITQSELAINSYDRQLLSETVNIVFHSAATVKFDEKLKLSVTINVLGTIRLIELCHNMINLNALIHVSTAYCNSDRINMSVDELIYTNLKILPEQMINLIDCLDDYFIDLITDKLIDLKPNTYTFTKSLAEYWLKLHSNNLPLVIVRPSIVLSCYDGPLKGWVDNINGPTGILAAAGKGLFRTMLCDPVKIADFIPVDMVINLMLVSAWDVAMNKSNDIPIYNCTTGLRKPITWKQFIDLSFKYIRKYPFGDVLYYPAGTVTRWHIENLINRYLFHNIPAFILDSFRWLTGNKLFFCRTQEKLRKAALCLEFFTTHEWHFNDENVRLLNLKLTTNDRREFCFDVAQIDWDKYIENYIMGIRRYIFKEDMNTLEKSRRQMSRLYYIYRGVQLLTIISLWRFLALRHPIINNIWLNAIKLLISLARMLPFL